MKFFLFLFLLFLGMPAAGHDDFLESASDTLEQACVFLRRVNSYCKTHTATECLAKYYNDMEPVKNNPVIYTLTVNIRLYEFPLNEDTPQEVREDFQLWKLNMQNSDLSLEENAKIQIRKAFSRYWCYFTEESV